MSADRRADRNAVGLLGLVWLLVSVRIWALGETFFLRDFWTNYLPARVLVRDAFAEGRWPLWNPWIGGGLPASPDPASSLFYFPAYPFLLISNQGWSLSVLVSLHLLVAAVGTWVLLRQRLAAEGAFIAAAVFAFGGLLISNQINAQFHYAYCLVPWWWWAFLSALEARDAAARLRFGLALAAVWALQLLAPDPQLAYVEGLSGLVAVLGFGPGRVRGVLGVAVVGLAAVVLSAPQVAAFAEALGQTSRTGFTDGEASTWSLPPQRLWELMLPLPFGATSPVTTFWAKAIVGKTWSNFYFASLYTGALAVPLSVLGLRGLDRRGRVMVGGAALLVAMAMGATLPFYHFARAVIPLWGAFRYPERLVVLPCLGLAFLIGRGVERLARPEASRGERALVGVPAVMGLLTWAWPRLLAAGEVPEASVSQVLGPAVVHTAGVALVAALVVFSRALPRGPALAALITLDLLLVASRTQETWTPPTSPPPPLSTSARLLFPLSDLSDALTTLPAEPALRRAFEDALARPNLNALRNVRTTNGVTSLELLRAGAVREVVGPERAALLYETEFLIGRPGLQLTSFAPAGSLAKGLDLYRARERPASVVCSGRWEPVASLQEARGVLASGGLSAESPARPDDSAATTVACALLRPQPGRLQVDLQPSSAPVLVSPSESWYPGWQVRFDEGPWEPAFPAQLAFVGAIAPPSTSKVEFSFTPRWFWPALIVAGLGWGALSLVALSAGVAYLKSRREKTTTAATRKLTT